MYLLHEPGTDEHIFLKDAPCAVAVRFLGPLTISDLRTFYGAADVLLFPSRYEGFGWPPLEAMACGCPVVSTTCASLGEVVGDAALTCDDPDDHPRLAALLKSVLTEKGVAAELRAAGPRRAAAFSPEASLTRVSDIYRKLTA